MTTLGKLAEERLLDIAAAVLTGLAIGWVEYRLFERVLNAAALRDIAVKLFSFALPAALLSLWNNRIRVLWGWAVIAIVGLTLTAGIDEIIWRANATPEQRAFLPEFSPFPFEIVVWFWQAFLIMAVAHYFGRFVLRMTQPNKSLDRSHGKRLSHHP
jgi:NhaP-type Na+/H+ or K+/H+ antiporter